MRTEYSDAEDSEQGILLTSSRLKRAIICSSIRYALALFSLLRNADEARLVEKFVEGDNEAKEHGRTGFRWRGEKTTPV